MPWACTSLHGVLGGLLSRGAYIPGGLITEKKKRSETSHSGADQSTFCMYRFQIKFQNILLD